ncbi:MAG: copper chaperone CopZ [Saprospiraceae bacterium]|jgi:copper chaperone CopZ
MIERTYTVQGMTCGGCVTKVQMTLKSVSGVSDAMVTLDPPVAKLHIAGAMPLSALQSALSEVGIYHISSTQSTTSDIQSISELPSKSWQTYWPLILIVLMLSMVSVLAQYPFRDFSWMLWMRFFMAGFFLVFAFFKLLNMKGFANSYAMYDIVALKWKGWGYIYPFCELALGIAYLINFQPYYTNLTTVIILGISSIGVIKSNLDKREIKCACLGDVFNLPMSTVTIVEDLTMVGMALLMLL